MGFITTLRREGGTDSGPATERKKNNNSLPKQSLRDLREYSNRFNSVSLESQKDRKRAELKKVLREIMEETFQI